MRRIAIIPARGGSKRIPKKNIIDFFGKPIIAYAIETALTSNLFDEVMVSTDSLEIAEIAKEYGAKVPFLRTEENASDEASTVEAILEVLNQYQQKGEIFDYCCCIYPITPLLSANLLKEGFDLLIKNNAFSVFPALAYSHPIQRGFTIDSKNKIQSLNSNYISTNTQNIKKVYHDAGQFYWFKTDFNKTNKDLISTESTIIVMDEMAVHDVDSPTDLKMLQLKYNQQNFKATSKNISKLHSPKFEFKTKTYSCLQKNEVSYREFKLIPIRYEDRIKIMQWRNEQLYHLRQKEPLTEEQQDRYFQMEVANLFHQKEPKQLLFSFLKDKILVGYGGLVHIDWNNKNAEISFVMDTSLEIGYFKNYWSIYLTLIEKVAFQELELNKIYIYSYDLRKQLYEVTDENNYLIEAKLKHHAFIDGNFIDVKIHSKLISNYEQSTNSN